MPYVARIYRDGNHSVPKNATNERLRVYFTQKWFFISFSAAFRGRFQADGNAKN